MNILLIDNETTLLEKLEDLIPGHQIVHKWNDLQNVDSDDFDLVILSGGSKFEIVGNEDKLKDEIRLIKERKTPLIGICLGCELIVESFGGSLEEMVEKHHGITDIEVVHNDLIFENTSRFKVYENHKWRINKLPSDFVCLVKSSHSFEIIKHNNLPIYGFQFHPEQFVDKTDGDKLFLNLIKIVEKQMKELTLSF